MAINLAKNYAPLLDEVYKEAALTEELVSDASVVREGANAHEILVPKMTVDGLGEYSRSTGYAEGAVSVEWETVSLDYERGVKFDIDSMDDEETFEIAFGQASNTLVKTKAAPEGDAYTFAKLAGKSGIRTATGTLSTGDNVLAAISAGIAQMDDDEVPAEGRILYITPTLYNKLIAIENYKFKEILDTFAVVKKVPQARFYTAITLKSGKNNEGFGYEKTAAVYKQTEDDDVVAGKTYYTKSGDVYTKVESPVKADIATYYEKTVEEGHDINFMIVDPAAVIKFDKHVANDVIPPALNPDSDGYLVKYRRYGTAFVLDNKAHGVYCHYKA